MARGTLGGSSGVSGVLWETLLEIPTPQLRGEFGEERQGDERKIRERKQVINEERKREIMRATDDGKE